MAIHLVGETIDAKRAHARAHSGEIIQLIRGVYADAGAGVEHAVLGHAVRIAHYLYPTAYLSSVSAQLLAPTLDGRLFLSGRRNRRTRLRALEIVQNEAPAHPSTVRAVVGDDRGELRIDVSSPRQRFLESFRLRSEHASAITTELRRQMADRLLQEHGSPRATADALWALARESQWYREGESAERYLLAEPTSPAHTKNRAALEEWLCLELGRAAGFEVPTAALIDMPDGIPPALVVERFDVRRGHHDTRRIALEDFCSILDLPAAAKYDGTIERAAKALRALSTAPDGDLDILFRRAAFAWLIADGDMHLKNLAVLRIANTGSASFDSIRFAPLYDAVTTRVFPGLTGDRMALKLSGKDDRLVAQGFFALARTMGLTKKAAQAAISELSERLEACAATLRLPIFARQYALEDQLLSLVKSRCATLRTSTGA